MATSSGLFSMPEFQGRNVLKLAPDAFIAVNSEVGIKFISPVSSDSSSEGYKTLDVRGGVTSININAAVSPAGASRANIEVIAPIYKGLHEDYYFTLPNGVRKSVFQPMMEIRIYFKGLKLKSGNPVYYPVFWGFISGISENYSGGVHTFSLVCSDLLAWWKYQKLTILPSAEGTALAGGPGPTRYPTLFEDMNPWQIIYNLVNKTGWKDEEGAHYDFVYTKLSKASFRPDFGDLLKSDSDVAGLFKGFAENANSYWQRKFGLSRTSPQADSERMPLEMFGLLNKIDLDNDRITTALSYNPANREYQTKVNIPELDLNFYMLSYVQPYGALNLYNGGSEALESTKLDIANEICAQTDMEFFLDTNGSLVFKPPFYNLDVTKSDADTYTIKAKDVINFSGDLNTDGICTYIEVFGPRYQFLPDLDSVAWHMDFDLIKRFGLRYQKLDLRYGVDAHQLRLLAAAKMAKINGRAFTGSVSIPMRPEIRLGYPVYLSHIDAYYYVTGISHSFSYGSSATTTLSLEYRRDRVFSDGSVSDTIAGDVLKGYVYRYGLKSSAESYYNNFGEATTEEKINKLESSIADAGGTPVQRALLENDVKKYESLRAGQVLSGPNGSGLYSISKAKVGPSSVKASSIDGKDAVVSNELIMISFPRLPVGENNVINRTEETYPYTDINGYRHIGAFPYGANLALRDKGTTLIEYNNPKENSIIVAAAQNASPNSADDANNRSGGNNQYPVIPGGPTPTRYPDVESITNGTEDPETAISLYDKKVKDYIKTEDNINEKDRPKSYTNIKNPSRAANTQDGYNKEADMLTGGSIG